jgi:membrane protease YdiL (CAAX protease family)
MVWCCSGFAAEVSVEDNPANHKLKLQAVENATREQYQATMAWYDDYLGKRGYDVVAAVERCRFLDAFTATFEYLDWLDTVYDEQTGCGTKLAERYPQHPEVELYVLDSNYGEERLAEGERLLKASRTGEWTESQLSRLYTQLALAHEETDRARATNMALLALSKDVTADVRLIAARGLIAEQKRAQALDILLAPFDAHDAKDYWYASQKMQLLASLGALQPAREIFATTKASGSSYSNLAAAKLLREMNAVDEARAELQSATNSTWNNATAVAGELFRLEFEHGTPEAALKAYEAMRDHGWKEDPMAINRVVLLARDVWLPWQWRDLLGIGASLGAIAASGLLLLIPVGAVQYRGLARRAKKNEAAPTADGWQLRHAWLAMMIVTVCQFVGLYFSGPLRMNVDLPTFGLEPVEPDMLARMAIGGEVLALLLAAMLALSMRAAVPKWVEHWSVTKAIAWGLGIAVLSRVPLLMSFSASPEAMNSRLSNDLVVEMLGHVRHHFGVLSAFWWMALAAPVLEEFVFRGVLREAFAKHIQLGWANVLQAALFAAWHQNLQAMPLLFVFGLVAGTLARRSGGLLAPIVLHIGFNLILGLILFR